MSFVVKTMGDKVLPTTDEPVLGEWEEAGLQSVDSPLT
jgi:hypothetical protein